MQRDGTLAGYFRGLFAYSQSLLSRLPLRLDPQPMSYVSDVLERAVDATRAEEVAHISALHRPRPDPSAGAGRPVGMNTIGILADRLSILAIKCWFLRNKHNKAAEADLIERNEVEQIVAAMCQAQPGSSTLLGKVTALEVTLHNADWNESYYGLLTSNLLMWEAQESMYVNNLADQDDSEVRALLSWASYGNLRRNRYVTSCEVQYWQDAQILREASGLVPADGEWTVLERRRTVLSPWVTLSERVVQAGGRHEPQVYHSFAQADYVSVLAITVQGQIGLVRQYRPALERSTLELPGGTVDEGEDPALSAARELEEETGLRPRSPLVFLGRIAPDVGRLDNVLWAYLAEGVEPVEGWTPEAGVERVLLDKADFNGKVANGELVNAGHLAMVALAQAQGRF